MNAELQEFLKSSLNGRDWPISRSRSGLYVARDTGWPQHVLGGPNMCWVAPTYAGCGAEDINNNA